MKKAMMRTILSLLLASAAFAAERETVICYLSWFNEVGSFVGSRTWRAGGYRYQALAEEERNYPLPAIDLPQRAPDFGTPEFTKLIYDSASAVQRTMKSSGFDAVAFDMLPIPKYDAARALADTNIPFSQFMTFLEWLRAAEESGMRVGIMPDIMNKSSDYPEGRKLVKDEWVRVLGAALDAMKDRPALWRIGGKPVVIHFGSDIVYGGPAPVSSDIKPDGGWRNVLADLRASGRELYFIADGRPHDYVLQWGTIADGLHLFAPAAPKEFLSDYQRDLAAALSIPLIWTVSPGYYRPGLSYTEPDFSRIDAAYRSAIAANAERIYFLTWNDFEERTDIAPSSHKGAHLLSIVARYNRWFKTGVPPAQSPESIVLAYPFRISSQVKTKSPVWGKRNAREKIDGTWSAPSYEPKLFYWANVSTKRTVTIAGLGTVELAPGISFGSLDGVKAGAVTAQYDGRSIELPAVEPDEGDENLDFRYIDILQPIPPAAKKMKIKTLPEVREDFEGYADTAVWTEKQFGGFVQSGEMEFAIADNPMRGNGNGSARCLHITSPVNTPLGKITVNIRAMPEGSMSFKVYSPCSAKAGPPYGYATWTAANKSGALFHGDVYEYLDRITAATGDKEPYGGYSAANIGALAGGWHTVSATWTKNGVSISHDGAVIKKGPMRAAPGGGVTMFTLTSADVSDGKRSSDIYIDDIVIESADTK